MLSSKSLLYRLFRESGGCKILITDDTVLDFQQDFLADHLRWHLVAACVIGHGAVLVDLAVLLCPNRQLMAQPIP